MSKKSTPPTFTVERIFSADKTIPQLVTNIIRTHLKNIDREERHQSKNKLPVE
jgi:hypothetical protein